MREMKNRLMQLFADFRFTQMRGELFTEKDAHEQLADHLLANGVIVCDMRAIKMENRPLVAQCLGRPLDEIIELVEAKDEGRIIVPPCKVGDKVYCIYEDNIGEQYFADKFVTGIFLKDLGLYVRCGFHYYNVDDFGKTVFLTRAEAEQALAEKGGAEVEIRID